MRRGPVVVVLAACLALAGCVTPRSWTPGPIVVETPSPTVAGTSAGPTATGTASTIAAPTPTVPAAAGAIRADKYPSAHFASPSGRIWCAIYSDNALCHFPNGMTMSAVPSSDVVCPGAELDVTGVSVIRSAEYFCSGDAEALPQTSGEYVGWWKGAGLPSVKYDRQVLAVLPYGRKLARGDYVCLSEKAGVTCGNTATGKGFKVSLSGVIFIK